MGATASMSSRVGMDGLLAVTVAFAIVSAGPTRATAACRAGSAGPGALRRESVSCSNNSRACIGTVTGCGKRHLRD